MTLTENLCKTVESNNMLKQEVKSITGHTSIFPMTTTTFIFIYIFKPFKPWNIQTWNQIHICHRNKQTRRYTYNFCS